MRGPAAARRSWSCRPRWSGWWSASRRSTSRAAPPADAGAARGRDRPAANRRPRPAPAHRRRRRLRHVRLPAAFSRPDTGRADRAHAHRRRPAGQADVVRDLGRGAGGRARAPAGQAAEGGGPRRRAARPHQATWDRFALEFADGGRLVLVDPRRLGRVRLDPDLGALGPGAEQVTPEEFRSLILKGTIAVKARLLDQSKIAGVGNLLADEVLWQAKVSPSARVNTLRRQDADRLYRALQSALRSAIAMGGAHTGDVISARHPGGTCPRCGAEMLHGTVGGRSTWWCSREQAGTDL